MPVEIRVDFETTLATHAWTEADPASPTGWSTVMPVVTTVITARATDPVAGVLPKLDRIAGAPVVTTRREPAPPPA